MNSGRRVGSARCDVCDGPRRVDAVVLACVARAIVLGSAPSSQMTEVIGRERPLAFSSLEVSGERFACSFLVNVSTVLDTGAGAKGSMEASSLSIPWGGCGSPPTLLVGTWFGDAGTCAILLWGLPHRDARVTLCAGPLCPGHIHAEV